MLYKSYIYKYELWIYGSVVYLFFSFFLIEYHFSLLLKFHSFVCTLVYFIHYWGGSDLFEGSSLWLMSSYYVMQCMRWLCVFLSPYFHCTLWNVNLCFFCLPDCLITPTRASGTGSSWQFIAGVRERRVRGRWRFQTRRLSCVTLRCWVSNGGMSFRPTWASHNLKSVCCDASHVQSKHSIIRKHLTLFPDLEPNSSIVCLHTCFFCSNMKLNLIAPSVLACFHTALCWFIPLCHMWNTFTFPNLL